jgi:hypothetical protein
MSSKTPLTDLLKGDAPAPSSSGNGAGWLLTLCLAGALALLVWNKFSDHSAPVPPDDDEQHQVEPKLDLKKHALVVIRDKKTLNDDLEYTITMQDDEFWGWAKQNLADVEILEDDDDIAKRLLQTVTEPPPLVVLRNVETRNIVWTMPLPKGSTDPIRSKLK